MDPIYLDTNATTVVDGRVLSAMQPWLADLAGNPGSAHLWGRRARQAVAEARAHVADLLGCDPDEVVLTSGGSESCNHAVKGAAWAREKNGRHLIVSAIEHPAVGAPARWLAGRGWRLDTLPVNKDGMVDPADLDALLRADTVLVCVMHANNETGVLQPVRALADRLQGHGAWLFADCAQSAGKVPLDVRALGLHLAAIAGHKLYAPKGVGALYVRRGVVLENLVHGAGQEQGRRAGTEAVAQVVALGEACRLARLDLAAEAARLAALRDRLAGRLRALVPDAVIHGERSPRLPGTLSIALSGHRTSDLLVALQDRLAASAGAACHGAGAEASPVLAAMGVPLELALGTLRLSVGRFTRDEDVERAVVLIGEVLRGQDPAD